jgi:hypothetical protein
MATFLFSCFKSLSTPISLGSPLCNFFPNCRILNFQKTKVVDFGKSDEGMFDDSCRRSLDNHPEVKNF